MKAETIRPNPVPFNVAITMTEEEANRLQLLSWHSHAISRILADKGIIPENEKENFKCLLDELNLSLHGRK